MKQDEIIDMAKEARLYLPYWNEECNPKTDPPSGWTMVSPLVFLLEHFAKLVAAKEREACAKVCDELVNEENSSDYQNAANWCLVRIKARGEQA